MSDALPGADVRRLLSRLRDGDVDGAIEAGLMRFDVAAFRDTLRDEDVALLLDAQRRLRFAWDARDRHRRRADRLARLATEREARRAPRPAAAAKPSLPPAAAAALARARAKASPSGKA